MYLNELCNEEAQTDFQNEKYSMDNKLIAMKSTNF